MSYLVPESASTSKIGGMRKARKRGHRNRFLIAVVPFAVAPA